MSRQIIANLRERFFVSRKFAQIGGLISLTHPHPNDITAPNMKSAHRSMTMTTTTSGSTREEFVLGRE
jgi:hypothetical protein